MSRTVCWWSDGAASAVAAMMVLKGTPDALLVTCDTGAEHEDNLRFRRDCEAHLGREVQVLQHEKYASTLEVWKGERFMSSPFGASCSRALKAGLRLQFERSDDAQVFGYTADRRDMMRAVAMAQRNPSMDIRTPLIAKGITKAGCLAILSTLGIKPPATYGLGFPNANCLRYGCVKASSPDYWSLVRQVSPDGFAETAAVARDLGVLLVEIHKERVSLDDLPADWPTLNPIAPACDFLCAMVEQDLARPALSEQGRDAA